jgi:hypothetical protein
MISPKQVETRQSVQVSVTATNGGDLAGELDVQLRVDGIPKSSKSIYLESGNSEVVFFEADEKEEGIHIVHVSELSSEFSVTIPEETGSTRLLGDFDLRDVVYTISILGTLVGVGGWVFRKRSERRRREFLFSKLMSDIDKIYSEFKMNSRKCEAELLDVREKVFEEFSKGVIDDDICQILLGRIEHYLEDIRQDINKS